MKTGSMRRRAKVAAGLPPSAKRQAEIMDDASKSGRAPGKWSGHPSAERPVKIRRPHSRRRSGSVGDHQ